MLNDFGVGSACAVIVAKGVVSETTVSVDVNVFVIIVFDTKFNTNANGGNFAKVVGGVAQRSSAGVNRFVVV